MVSCRGKPLIPEIKKLTVSVKQYFDRNKLTPAEPSVKRTADALGIGIATVKRIMADYNRDPRLLDKPAKLRGRPIYAVSVSYQESARSYIRAANKKGEYITLAVIKNFLEEEYPDESFNKATLARMLAATQNCSKNDHLKMRGKMLHFSGARPGDFSLPTRQTSDPVQDSITSFILKLFPSISTVSA